MPRRAKYQVFVSSTYNDLHAEREAVVWKILSARHIPVGMENFTASHDRGWKTIQRVLDDTDYYVLILAGMYGSIDMTTGISWTQREYEYAVSKGIPVLAFVRNDTHITVDKQERDEELRAKRDALVARARNSHLCKAWGTKEELAGLVVDSLRNHIDDDEGAAGERPGWFRGDQIASPDVANALARLTEENARLREQLASVDQKLPEIEVNSLWLSRGLEYGFEEGYAFLRCGLLNRGAATARDLTVDVAILDIVGEYLVEPPRGEEVEVVPVIHDAIPRWMVDPNEHVYVDSYKVIETEGQCRQRIKFIAPNVQERLVPMGFVQPLEPGSAISVEVVVRITDISGRSWSLTKVLQPHEDDERPLATGK